MPHENCVVSIHPALQFSRHINSVLSIFTLLFCLHATGTLCCQYSPCSPLFTPQEHCAVTARGRESPTEGKPVCPPAELRQKVYEGGADRPSPDKPGTITSLPSVRIPLLAGPDTGRKSATPTPPRPPSLSFLGTNTQKKGSLKNKNFLRKVKGWGGGGIRYSVKEVVWRKIGSTNCMNQNQNRDLPGPPREEGSKYPLAVPVMVVKCCLMSSDVS